MPPWNYITHMVLGHTMSHPQWHHTHPLGLNGDTHGPGMNTRPPITQTITRLRLNSSITTTKITWPCTAITLIEAGDQHPLGPQKGHGANPAIVPKEEEEVDPALRI